MGLRPSLSELAPLLATGAALLCARPAGALTQLASPVELTATVNGPRLLPPADVDGDGDLDLLLTGEGGRRLYWVEQVHGSPGPPVLLLESPSAPTLWCLSDLDGDGDLDALALTRAPSQLYIHEREGDRYLAARRETGFQGDALDLDVGDIDQDGLPDVLVALDAGQPAHRGHFILRGLGGGHLGWPTRFTPGSQAASGVVAGPFQLADLDLDGDLDVLVQDHDLERIVWFRNQGAPFAQGPLIVDDQLRALASVEAADLDGDGRLDLIASGTPSSLDRGQQVLFYRGSSNGAFVAPVSLSTDLTIDPAPLTTADADGDGDLDVLFSTTKGAGVWLERLSAGFAAAPRAFPAQPGWDVLDQQLVDLDRDHQPDRVVACSTEQIGWFGGLGAGDFGLPQEITRRTDGAVAAVAVDMNHDGDLDLLVAATGALQAMALENLGGGRFGLPELAFKIRADLEQMLATDLDGDGDRDLVLTSFSGGWIDVRPLTPSGFDPPFRLRTFTPSTGGTVTATDVDGDGRVDLAVSTLGEGDVLWFQGGATGLDPQPRILIRDQPSVADLVVRDVDGDGAGDLVLAGPGFGGSVGWFPGQGAGNFGARVAIPTINFQPRNVVPMDADGDGDLDLVVGGAGFVFPLLEWIPQVAPGQFGGADYVGSAVQGWASVKAVDVDLDGDLDLVTTPRDASIEPLALTVYTAPFGAPPVVVQRPQGVSSFLVDDVDDDGDPDVVFTSERGDSVTWLRGTSRGFLGEVECASPAEDPVDLGAVGSPRRAVNAFQLQLRRLDPGTLAMFLTSQAPGFVTQPGGSLGTLCLGGSVGRFNRPGEAQFAGAHGTVSLDVDLGEIPQPLAPRNVIAGQTWRFQAWYRDSVNGTATSNFSGSLAVKFR
jgi:hypothetical protein